MNIGKKLDEVLKQIEGTKKRGAEARQRLESAIGVRVEAELCGESVDEKETEIAKAEVVALSKTIAALEEQAASLGQQSNDEGYRGEKARLLDISKKADAALGRLLDRRLGAFADMDEIQRLAREEAVISDTWNDKAAAEGLKRLHRPVTNWATAAAAVLFGGAEVDLLSRAFNEELRKFRESAASLKE